MIKVRVPATTANLGPGFDAFGMAFKLYNTFTMEERDNGKLTIRGVEKRYQGKSNLTYKAMLKVFNKVGYRPKGIYLHSDVDIPISRGLGSSATCIVAGLVGANVICGSKLTGSELFDLAVEMEGHPDNVAPAMYGGLTVSLSNEEGNFHIKKEVSPELEFYAAIPDFSLSTFEARKALPDRIPHVDARKNVARATMTFLALCEGPVDLLKISMEDFLHQPQRKHLIDHYDEVEAAALKHGALNVAISGAGPTILIINDRNNLTFSKYMENFMAQSLPGWQFRLLEPDNIGVAINVSE